MVATKINLMKTQCHAVITLTWYRVKTMSTWEFVIRKFHNMKISTLLNAMKDRTVLSNNDLQLYIILSNCIGLILSAILHTERRKAPFLVVLDAKTMSEVGRAEFNGIQMHRDFHGIFQKF